MSTSIPSVTVCCSTKARWTVCSRGQAVLDGDGIFGQVNKVNAGTAEVILISDPEHAIPVQSNRSGVRTIAVGTGDSNKLSLPFVTVEADLQPGRLLLSTGHGRRFPAGIPPSRR
jgi:rod shape-determining protein MreC